MSDDSEDARREAITTVLDEARAVIDHQVEFFIQSDREAIRVVRLNLVILSAFTAGAVSLVTNSGGEFTLPWQFVAGTFFLLTSIVTATRLYFKTKIYVGFADSPRVDVETVTGMNPTKSPDEPTGMGTSGEDWDPPKQRADVSTESGSGPPTAILRPLLLDYNRGIHHNNVHSRYTSMLYRRSVYQLAVAYALYTLGVLALTQFSLFAKQSGVDPNLPTLLGIVVVLVGFGLFADALVGFLLLSRESTDDAPEARELDPFEYSHYGPTAPAFVAEFVDASNEPSNDSVPANGEETENESAPENGEEVEKDSK